jgi:hypothetical protein
MKKKLIITLVLVIVVLFIPTVYGGSSLVQGVYTKLRGDIQVNTDKKITDLQTQMTTKADAALGKVKDYQTTWINGEIEKYYNEKLKEIGNDATYNDQLNELSALGSQLLKDEKARIDAAINAALGK